MTDDYEIGRGNPPKEHQFKKGQSGNPKGRPPKPRSSTELLKKILSKRISIKDNGVIKIMTKEELFMTQLVNDAISGKARAQALLLKMLNDPNMQQQSGLTLEMAMKMALPHIYSRIKPTTGLPKTKA